jgi:hypothetical protein
LIHKEFIEMSWKIKNPLVSAQPIETVATTQSPVHALGDIVIAEHPTYGAGEFIYLQGLAGTELGTWVTYNADDWSSTLLAANAIGPVAIAMGATVANTFGWYQISGKAVGKVLTGFVDNANVYATATAGSVDDAIVAGDRVKLAKGASAIGTPAAGLAEMEIHRPFMDDGLAA